MREPRDLDPLRRRGPLRIDRLVTPGGCRYTYSNLRVEGLGGVSSDVYSGVDVDC